MVTQIQDVSTVEPQDLSTVLPNEIMVHQNATFFIGLTKAIRHEHTSIIAGTIENGNLTVLLRVGKDRYPVSNSRLRLVFGSVDDELKFPLRGERSYVAYAITLKQYNQLILSLSLANIMSEKPISCYQQPSSLETDLKQLHFKLTEINIGCSPYEGNQAEMALKESMNRFDMKTNNCRHMGIAIIKHVLNVKILPGQVSSQYLDDLPFQAQFNEARPTSFYVFPSPPQGDIKKKSGLFKLYHYLTSLNANDAKLPIISELYIQVKSYFANGAAAEEREAFISCLQNWSHTHSALFPKESFSNNIFGFFSSIFFSSPLIIDNILDEIIKNLSHTPPLCADKKMSSKTHISDQETSVLSP